MTVIAYRDGHMAADSSCWQGETNAHSMRKVHRIGGGLVGAAGRVSAIGPFLRWLRDGAEEELFPKGDFEALVVDPAGRVTTWEGFAHTPVRVQDPYCAIGSGQAIALGALHAGANAREAVKAAIKHHTHVSGPVRVYRLNK